MPQLREMAAVSALVIPVFGHVYNEREVAEQEHRLAEAHFKEVMRYRDATNPDHQRRYRDAFDRRVAARERLVAFIPGECCG